MTDPLKEMMDMAAEASDVKEFQKAVFYSSSVIPNESCLVCGSDNVRMMYSLTEGRTHACEDCYEGYIASDIKTWNDWAKGNDV